MRLTRLVFSLVVILLSAFASKVAAQTATTGAVLGTVTDPSGAVIVGAEVKLEGRATNFVTTQNANEDGQYSFPSVPPGVYTLTISKQGFRTASVAELKVDVARSYTLNIVLELGQVSEVVQVEAAAQIELQTTDASIGNVIPPDVLGRLGNLTRSVVEFLTLQPGVMPTTGANSGGAVTGARSDQSTFTLDGVDITDNSIGGGATLAPLLPINLGNVEEFRVGVANPNATFGRSAGGQVAVVSRRGTNDFHGSAWWTHQNDNLNANSWTNNRNKIAKAELKDNRFGGNVGGPIWPEKLFFFFDYFGRRFPQTFDVSRIVPSDTLRQGILRFRDSAGNVVSYNLATSTLCGSANNQRCDPRTIGISPTIQALWSNLPAATDPSGGDQLNTQLFRDTVSVPLSEDIENARFDYNITSKWRLHGGYTYLRRIQKSSAQLDVRGGNTQPAASVPVRNDGLTTSLTGEITPSLINTFRFGFVRTRNDTIRFTPTASATELAIPGTDSAAGFIALDLGLLDEPVDVDTQRARTQGNNNQNFQFIDDATWIKGRHSLQFGANVRHLPTRHLRNDKVVGSLASLVGLLDDSSFISIPSSARPPTCTATLTTNCLRSGDVTRWNRLYTGALGMMDRISILTTRDGSLNPLPFGTPLIADTELKAYEFYVQDTWRIWPSFTLTYGLAYQWQTPPVEKDGKQTLVIDAATGEFLSSKTYLVRKAEAARNGQSFNPQLGYVPINSSGRDNIFDIDRNNWGPRVSAAWQPSFQSGFLGGLFGDRKTVMRGGFGIVYDRLNTVQSVIIPTLGVGFAQTISVNGPNCNASGAGGTACNPAGADPVSSFRVGVDGTIPLPTVPAASIPIVPAEFFSETLSFQVDPDFKVGMNYSGDLTIQRELPGNMILEVGWAGRWARNLNQSKNFNAVPFFHKDPASGQTFAQAFDSIATQLRNGVAATSLANEPWFGGQSPSLPTLQALGVCGTTSGGVPITNATQCWASGFSSEFVDGLLGDLFITGIDLNRSLAGLSTLSNMQVLELFMRTDGGISNYHGLLVTLRKRVSHGLYFDVNYTLSKSLDQVGAVQNTAGYFPNPYDPNTDYGPSFFDRRHTFNASWLYELPFGRGRRFGAQRGVLDKFIGGWYLSGIFTANSGLPLIVEESDQVFGGGIVFGFETGAIPTADPSTFGNSTHSPVAGSGGIGTTGDPSTTPPGSGLNLFADPEDVFNSFRHVLLSQDGRSGRGNPLRGLPKWNLDFSIGKRTKITERVGTTFHFDFFNLFNHVDFNDPASLTFQNPAAFGVITSQFVPPNRNAGSRWIQFGFRVDF